MTMPLIRFDGVTKRFHAVTALDSVCFDVRPGEFHALCGENGAGKSTLMKILSGVITEYEGRIELAGETLVVNAAMFCGCRPSFSAPSVSGSVSSLV